MSDYNPVAMEQALRAVVRGGVRMDRSVRGAYATDASIYQFMPLAVIEPLDREDLIAAIRCCAQHGWSMLPRGGGTSLVGQSVGHSVVIDASRHCRKVLDLNIEERWVRVQPGLVRDELNRYLAPHGLHFAPDPATTNRATIGGMIANNSSGMRSIRYGMTMDHLLEVELALASGEVVTLGPVTADDLEGSPTDRAAVIRQTFRRLIDRERDEILARYPRVARRAGGYPLDAFAGPLPWNMAKLIAGSEGTLGFILSATLNLEPVPRYSGLCLAHFASTGAGLRAVKPIVDLGPSSVEWMDGLIIQQARNHPLTQATCRMIEGAPSALLVVEAQSDDATEVREKLQAIQSMLLTTGRCYAAPVMDDAKAVAEVWVMRESALGLMTTVEGPRKPTPYIEDAAVPLEVLPDYVESVLAVCARYDQPVSLFAHAGAGLLHIRPMHDLRDPVDLDQFRRIQDEVFELVLKYGGSWSGEHGDGIVRGGFNRRFFGDRIFHTFEEVKALFDPDGLMNPGKIVNVPPRDQNLRVTQRQASVPVTTAYDWTKEGGLARAAAQCTGIGACRKVRSGVMCPSFMATRDELHSTRGRANVLRLALSGDLGPDALTDSQTLDVFDLCLSCKGCRSECPNKVDVGKMKAELQHQYYRKHRRPWRAHLFARPGELGRWHAGPQSALVNAALGSRAVRALMEWVLGLDARRRLPRYASLTLSAWFKNRPAASGRPVVLFNDVYMEYYQPEIGQAAVRVLEAAGYSVTLTDPLDSQRPALSLGMLSRAKRRGKELVKKLEPYVDQGWPIVVVEPSCVTALTQDLPDLLSDASTRRVAARVRLIDNFLVDAMDNGEAKWPELSGAGQQVFFHPHCHQCAIDNGRGAATLLKMVRDAEIVVSQAGCCGMAGAFGYEKKHYDISKKIAEDRLLPALNDVPASTVVLASGFSCRHQIADLSGRKAVHPLQWIDSLLTSTP